MYTTLANTLKVADEHIRYDECAKKVIANISVAALILKTCTDEFAEFDAEYIADNCIGHVSIVESAAHQDHGRGLDGDERLECLNSESSSINEGTVHFDVKFRANLPKENGKSISLMINLEMQKKDNPGYAVATRGIYYSARMISEQYGTVFRESEYHKIQKAYSIWICPEPTKKRKNSIIKYCITEKELYGKSFTDYKDYDKMNVVIVNLGDMEGAIDNQALDFLGTLFSIKMSFEEKKEKLGSKYGIKMTKELERDLSEMCSLSFGIEEIGIRKGIEQGVEEGTFKTLLRLVEKGKITIVDAAETAGMGVDALLKKKEEYERSGE